MKHQSDSEVLLYQTDGTTTRRTATTRYTIHDRDKLDTLLR